MPAEKEDKVFDELPSAEDFLLRVPLYKSFCFNEDEKNPFFALEHFKGSLDCHCPVCGKHSVFNRLGEPK